MTISPSTPRLSEPQPLRRIRDSDLAYVKTRNKLKAFTTVHQELKRSGISRRDLGIRLGKGDDRVSHLLSAPGNWTLDTISELLWAISGGVPTFGIAYPLNLPPRNHRRPDWLEPTSGNEVRLVHTVTGATGPTMVSVTVSGDILPNGSASTASARATVEVVDA
jgi:hypothetical protein